MRVLGMFHAYLPTHGAGAEGMAHALLRHLVNHEHQVDVILSRVDHTVPRDYTFDGVRVHAHQGKTQTPNWIADNDLRPHVIVTHLENTPRAAVLGKMFSVPVVQLLHNDRTETLNSTIRHRFAMVVANTEWLAQSFQDYWRQHNVVGDTRTLVIRPPVNPDDYRPTGTVNREYVTLVNLTGPKGAGTFYALAQRLPEFKFLGVRGAYGIQMTRSDLRNVTIIDTVLSHQMVQQVYNRTKVVLMPSDYESYGRVAAEALCSGIPVIAHPTPGLKESLGEAGIFYHRESIDSWAAELRRLHTPRGWSASSKRALDRAKLLDPNFELEMWRRAMEEVASVPLATRHR